MMRPVFVTCREQELKTKADAEERLAAPNVRQNRLRQPGLTQAGDGVSKSADTGEHQLVCLGHTVRIAGDVGAEADALERLLHAAQVGHAVINDRYSVHC